jgi:hypothetical protein
VDVYRFRGVIAVPLKVQWEVQRAMDEEWTTIVTRQIGARLRRALDIDAAAITPLMAERLEQLRRAEERLRMSAAEMKRPAVMKVAE